MFTLTGDTANQILSNVGFLRREENRSIWRKTSQSSEEIQQTQPTCDTESGNQTRTTVVGGKCYHHHATTALPNKQNPNPKQTESKITIPCPVKLTLDSSSLIFYIFVWLSVSLTLVNVQVSK